MSETATQPTLQEFFTVIWDDWGSRVSGGLSVPFTALALWVKADYAKAIWGVLAVAAILATLYQVWARERKSVCALQEQLNTRANMGGTVLLELGLNNPLADQTKKGSVFRFTFGCFNNGRVSCEIAKVMAHIIPPNGFEFTMESEIYPPGKAEALSSFSCQGDITVRGTSPEELKASKISIYLVDIFGVAHKDIITKISPRLFIPDRFQDTRGTGGFA